jgi:alpha-amylase/alpha-mannosidase (GH57 family)
MNQTIRGFGRPASVAFALILAGTTAFAQPRAAGDGVVFTYRAPGATSVAVVGDFNGWSRDLDLMARDSSGAWVRTRTLSPGIFQYKFLVDGTEYVLDPANPATVDNYNRTARNSVFVLTQERTIELTATPPLPQPNLEDRYAPAPDRKPLYLNIIWHQHQPLYVNPATDQLAGPWVRTHATKDYYDMAAMLAAYPDIHCTINLTSSLLVQLQEYYVKRLRPFVNVRTNTVDVAGFMKKWKGKTDPWIDLALTPTSSFGAREKDYLYRTSWNAFGISEVMLDRFPEYRALRSRLPSDGPRGDDIFNEQQLRELKFWFFLAQFDPDFLAGPVVMPDKSVCDLSDLVEKKTDGTYRLRRPVTETDCRRIVAEAVKVMAAVVPIHKALRYDPAARTGQVEIITTPYYHPILPLIYDSDLARTCQPQDSLPPRYSYPDDARAQIAKAVRFYRETFGWEPTGMWPGEGSVAQPVLELFRSNGIAWTASDVRVLQRSRPSGRPNTTPYRFPAGDGSMALVFRDTELSDRIGFKYQSYEGEVAAEDFVRSILALAPSSTDPDMMLTVILDGENAWEWYRFDNDAKQFLNALYRKLSLLFRERRIITVTTTEYLEGNPARGVPAHPVASLPGMEWLWPGSWINGNYDTWIGEPEENRAWEYLLRARMDLEQSGLPAPAPGAAAPAPGTRGYNAHQAWEAMYAAEGSDWYWWFGSDQQAPGGDDPFDVAFRTHLTNVYRFATRAGAKMPERTFRPLVRPGGRAPEAAGTQGGVMAKGTGQSQAVLLTCDARAAAAPRRIYVAGNLPALGDWRPNVVEMHDNGLNGDREAGDGIWTLLFEAPVGTEIQYKYTNNGQPGVWSPGEEFPARHRTLVIQKPTVTPHIQEDVFGKE